MHHRMALLKERAFWRWGTSNIVNTTLQYIEKAKEECMIAFWALGLFSDEVKGNDCLTPVKWMAFPGE